MYKYIYTYPMVLATAHRSAVLCIELYSNGGFTSLWGTVPPKHPCEWQSTINHPAIGVPPGLRQS